MWFNDMYPLGLCDALDKKLRYHRILRILDWVDHIKKTRRTRSFQPSHGERLPRLRHQRLPDS